MQLEFFAALWAVAVWMKSNAQCLVIGLSTSSENRTAGRDCPTSSYHAARRVRTTGWDKTAFPTLSPTAGFVRTIRSTSAILPRCCFKFCAGRGAPAVGAGHYGRDVHRSRKRGCRGPSSSRKADALHRERKRSQEFRSRLRRLCECLGKGVSFERRRRWLPSMGEENRRRLRRTLAR